MGARRSDGAKVRTGGERELHHDDEDRVRAGLQGDLPGPRQKGLHDHPSARVQGDVGSTVQGRPKDRMQKGESVAA